MNGLSAAAPRTYVEAVAHALGTERAALVDVSGGRCAVIASIGAEAAGAWLVPYLADAGADPVVCDRHRPGDAFADALEAHGIAFFAAIRVARAGDVFLCAFDTELRVLSGAQRYVLESLAAAIAERLELRELRSASRITAERNVLRDERLRLLESVVVNANDAVLITEAEPVEEPGPRIRYANAAFTRTTGYSLEEVLGRTPRILQGPDTSDEARAKLRRALKAWRPVEVELVNYRKDGTAFNVELSIVPVADENGWYTHWVSVQRDITHRKTAEEQHTRARVAIAQNETLAYRAFHDELTGLRNRAYFMERLDGTVRRAAGSHAESAAVLFFDLDRFKLVNDSLGHGAGDLLLVEVARRLSGCVRSQDVLARMGGDEFTVLVEDVEDIEAILAVASRILAALSEPIRLAGQEVFVYASIGIALVDARYARGEDVLRDADSAMYRAKSDGGMRYAFFDETMYASAVESLRVQMDLRRAVERDEFAVLYEPIVDVRTRTVVGVEALVRWDHPERGRIGPIDFIGVAEKIGLITSIGSFVLRRACTDVRRLHARHPHLTLNVNVSPREMYDPAFLHGLRAVLEETGFPAALLQIEVTESVFLDRADYIGELLAAIRAMGVRIALDDFGTGYSSLSYLERFPFDTLKIDRSFTQRIADSKIGFAIVRAIVDLARALDMDVVGEGVETGGQLALLGASDCTLAQGYFFSRPAELGALEALLQPVPERAGQPAGARDRAERRTAMPSMR